MPSRDLWHTSQVKYHAKWLAGSVTYSLHAFSPPNNRTLQSTNVGDNIKLDKFNSKHVNTYDGRDNTWIRQGISNINQQAYIQWCSYTVLSLKASDICHESQRTITSVRTAVLTKNLFWWISYTTNYNTALYPKNSHLWEKLTRF